MAEENMSDDARIEERWMEEVETADSDKLVRVRVVIEAVEDIGMEMTFQP